MTVVTLLKGQNAAIPEDVSTLDVTVSWAEADLELDGSALLLSSSGSVRSDHDFVFYNQPESADSSVRHLGSGTTEVGRYESLSIDLESVPADVAVIAIAGSAIDAPLGRFGPLTMQIRAGNGDVVGEYVTADATSELAVVFGEIYRRGSSWKLRAVGQGWDSGLASLAENFGVNVDLEDQDPGTEPHESAPTPERVSADSVLADSAPQDPPPSNIGRS